ncbi:hypothetical protein [Rhodocytophaga rosea]|uniref:hypothetical protein n=1 Tax=Rhodocytophaga rosea TaxID=2704465 RepID=UPI0018D6C6F6|nr:hypothetical protein [Rhodocytophaga rosea]
MKNTSFLLNILIIFFAAITLTSCDVIGDIFEAGVWTGLVGLVLVIVLVFWLFSRFRK